MSGAGDKPLGVSQDAQLRRSIATLTTERDKWRRLETEAAQYVETVICLRTGFTGEPPHVGWKGLGLALTEALDERDALRADVTRLTASLAAAEGEAIPKHLTSAQVNDACLSYRHDYGLCTESEARFMRRECAEWFRSIRAALTGPAS